MQRALVRGQWAATRDNLRAKEKKWLVVYSAPLPYAQNILFFLGLFAVSSIAGAQAVDEDKPYGRVCISLYEPKSRRKRGAVCKCRALSESSKTVHAYIDASNKCSVLVAALTKDGKLVNGWRPQLAEVAGEFEETLVPKAAVKWDWTTASGPFDFYVLFLAPESKEVAEAKKLIDAMQAAKDDRLLAMQTGKLRELIGRITSEKEKINQAPASEPEVGGVFRGAAFPWRQFAQSVNFAADRPGAVILSSDGAEKK